MTVHLNKLRGVERAGSEESTNARQMSQSTYGIVTSPIPSIFFSSVTRWYNASQLLQRNKTVLKSWCGMCLLKRPRKNSKNFLGK